MLKIAAANGFDRQRIVAQCAEAFRKSEFIGDWESQEVVPADERKEIEPVNQVPLPTREIAEAWKGGKAP